MPGEANWAALPVATGEPVQLEFVYSLTVEPASADPSTLGELLLAGDDGVVPVSVGAGGGVVSLPTTSTLEPVLDCPSGLVIVTSCDPLLAAVVFRSRVTWVGSV